MFPIVKALFPLHYMSCFGYSTLVHTTNPRVPVGTEMFLDSTRAEIAFPYTYTTPITHTYYSTLTFPNGGEMHLDILDAEIDVDAYHKVAFKCQTVVVASIINDGTYFTVDSSNYTYKFQKTYQRRVKSKQTIKMLFQ